jgi:phosphoribosylglycinamide formyltransferase-1
MPSKTCNVVVLLSGTGSNLQALIDSTRRRQPGAHRAVISNRADAYGLQRARAGIDTALLDHKGSTAARPSMPR